MKNYNAMVFRTTQPQEQIHHFYKWKINFLKEHLQR
jgi:hypothetical protein